MANFVPVTTVASPQQMHALAVGLNAALRGDTMSTARATAEAGATTLTIQDARCRAGRLATLVPLNAAAGKATWWLAGMGKGWAEFSFFAALEGEAAFGVAFLGAGDSK